MLASQIFDLFDVKKRGVIDFGDFVRALNVFHPNIPMEEKIDCRLLSFHSIMICLISYLSKKFELPDSLVQAIRYGWHRVY
jgi:hypothetical protein